MRILSILFICLIQISVFGQKGTLLFPWKKVKDSFGANINPYYEFDLDHGDIINWGNKRYSSFKLVFKNDNYVEPQLTEKHFIRYDSVLKKVEVLEKKDSVRAFYLFSEKYKEEICSDVPRTNFVLANYCIKLDKTIHIKNQHQLFVYNCKYKKKTLSNVSLIKKVFIINNIRIVGLVSSINGEDIVFSVKNICLKRRIKMGIRHSQNPTDE